VRRVSPKSVIVIGGHVAATPGIEKLVDADHFVPRRRHLLDAPVPRRRRHRPHPPPGNRLWLRRPHHGAEAAPGQGPHRRHHHSVGGVPHGLQLLHTSAFFGGKGKFLNFYNTGEELFGVMSEMEAKLDVKSSS